MESRRLSEAELEQLNLYSELSAEQDELASFGASPEERWHLVDEYDSIIALAEIAKSARQTIQRKYSQLEPRDADVFSVRGIPHWRPDSETSAPVGYVMRVPESREVWLKFALAKEDGSGQQVTLLDQLSESPEKTGFTNGGLYQTKLTPGERTFRYVPKADEDGAFVFELWLDEVQLLESRFMESDSNSRGWSSLGGREQSDFSPRQRLPWLFSSRVEWEPSAGEGFLESEFRPTLWLSDKRSVHFEDFPTKTGSDD